MHISEAFYDGIYMVSDLNVAIPLQDPSVRRSHVLIEKRVAKGLEGQMEVYHLDRDNHKIIFTSQLRSSSDTVSTLDQITLTQVVTSASGHICNRSAACSGIPGP